MSARDELAAVLYQARWVDGIRDESLMTDSAIAEAILEAGYRKPRTITTAEELDDLPVGTVVLDSERDVCERMRFGWCAIVKEDGSHPWLLDGAEDVELPATVLHEPGPES